MKTHVTTVLFTISFCLATNDYIAKHDAINVFVQLSNILKPRLYFNDAINQTQYAMLYIPPPNATNFATVSLFPRRSIYPGDWILNNNDNVRNNNKENKNKNKNKNNNNNNNNVRNNNNNNNSDDDIKKINSNNNPTANVSSNYVILQPYQISRRFKVHTEQILIGNGLLPQAVEWVSTTFLKQPKIIMLYTYLLPCSNERNGWRNCIDWIENDLLINRYKEYQIVLGFSEHYERNSTKIEERLSNALRNHNQHSYLVRVKNLLKKRNHSERTTQPTER